MAISEHDRYELQKWFVENAGEQVAETLMAHLPPVGWADVATKRDLEHLEGVLRMEMRAESSSLRVELQRSLRVQTVMMFGLNLTMLSAFAAIVR